MKTSRRAFTELCVDGLSSLCQIEKQEAKHGLETLGTERDKLLCDLYVQEYKVTVGDEMGACVLTGCVGLPLLSGMWLILVLVVPGAFDVGGWFLPIVGPVVMFGGVQWRRHADCRVRRALAEARIKTIDKLIAETCDSNATGPIVNSISLTGDLRASFADTLTRLLPGVAVSSTVPLTTAQRFTLISLFNLRYVRPHERLLVTILDLFVRTGDSLELREMRRMASDDLLLRHAAAGLRDKLVSSVGCLQTRLESEKLRGVLLKPSISPSAEQTLLRPAEGQGSPTQAESLPRAANLDSTDERVN